jgi:hypothetical protein
MNERNGIPSDIKQIINDENEASKTLSKKQRQQRRHELSKPSMISARLSSLLAERFPPSVIGDHLEVLLSAVTVTNPSFLLKSVVPYEMGILFQKALQSRFHLSLVFMDGHMLRQSMPSFS